MAINYGKGKNTSNYNLLDSPQTQVSVNFSSGEAVGCSWEEHLGSSRYTIQKESNSTAVQILLLQFVKQAWCPLMKNIIINIVCTVIVISR